MRKSPFKILFIVLHLVFLGTSCGLATPAAQIEATNPQHTCCGADSQDARKTYPNETTDSSDNLNPLIESATSLEKSLFVALQENYSQYRQRLYLSQSPGTLDPPPQNG